MKSNLAKSALVTILGLVATAVPGYCSAFQAFLTFSSTSPSGTITVNNNNQNSSETITNISNVTYNSLLISGAPDAADNGTWSVTSTLNWTSSQGLLVNTTFGSCSGCSAGHNLDTLTFTSMESISPSLLTLPYSSTATQTGTTQGFNTNLGGTSVTIGFGTATNMQTLGTFLSDLGFTGGTLSQLSFLSGAVGGGISGSGTGNNTFTAASETLNVTITSTPEPVSFLLLATGLFALGLIARKRLVRS